MPVTPTGNQGTFNEWSYGGLALPPTVVYYGNDYDVDPSYFGGNIFWTTLTAQRMTCYGPFFKAPGAGTVVLEAFCKGGTNAQKIRLALYQDNGNATDRHVKIGTADTQSYNAGSRPSALTGVGAEFSVGSGASAAWRGDLATAIPVTANTIYHVGVWTENVASGAQFITYSGQVNANRYRGAINYSSSGSPGAFPGTSTDGEAEHISIRITFYPAALTAPMVGAAQVDGVRGVTATWIAIPGATHYEVERVKNGGTPAAHGAVTGTSYPDYDVQDGATYAYRVRAWNDITPGPWGTSSTVTVTGGVRVAMVTATPTNPALSVRIDNPHRGGFGLNVTVPGYTGEFFEYKRVGFEWRNLEPTLGNYTIAPIITFLNSLGTNQRGWIMVRTSVPGNTATLPADMASSRFNISGSISSPAQYPNWNDSYHLHPNGTSGRIQMLANAIANLETSPGVKLKDDPRLGLLDVGIGAQYGELAGDWGLDVPTGPTRTLVVTAMPNAFPNKKFVINAMDTKSTDEELMFWDALNHPQIIGFSQFALGRDAVPYMLQQFRLNRSLRLQNRMIGRDEFRSCEWFGPFEDPADTNEITLATLDVPRMRIHSIGGINHTHVPSYGPTNLARVLQQYTDAGYRFDPKVVRYPAPIALGNTAPLQIVWQNVGNGPMPESRLPQIQLRRAGVIFWSQTLSLDLSTLLPGMPPTIYTDFITVTGNVPITDPNNPATLYDLVLQVPSTGVRVPALKLGVTPETAGNTYVIATGLTVQAGDKSEDPGTPVGGRHVIADRVGQYTATTGQAALVLGDTLPGHRTFAAVLNAGDTCPYVIGDRDAAEWEVGIGTLLSSGALSRTTVLSSSNGGLPVTLSPGAKRVVITHTASNTPQFAPDGTLNLPTVAAPAAPVAGVDLYPALIAGRPTLHLMASDGSARPQERAFWDAGRLLILPGSSSSPTVLGGGVNTTATTVSRPTPDTTALPLSAAVRQRYASGTTASSLADIRASLLTCYRGTAAGRGGFEHAIVFGTGVVVASVTNAFIGLRAAASGGAPSGIIAGTQPSALTDIIGMAFDRTQTTWRIMHNDSSGTATAIDLGADFPVDASSLYRLHLAADPFAGPVHYEVVNIGTGARAAGTLTTDLPSGSTFLGVSNYISMNSGTTAVAIDLVSVDHRPRW